MTVGGRITLLSQGQKNDTSFPLMVGISLPHFQQVMSDGEPELDMFAVLLLLVAESELWVICCNRFLHWDCNYGGKKERMPINFSDYQLYMHNSIVS